MPFGLGPKGSSGAIRGNVIVGDERPSSDLFLERLLLSQSVAHQNNTHGEGDQCHHSHNLNLELQVSSPPF